jgi:SAM-dependent methyltransferase
MTTLPAYQVDWAQQAGHLTDAAREDHAWHLAVARDLVRRTDRLALDVGCGAAGMTLAIARVMTCGRIIAADSDPEILDAARAHVQTEWTDPRVAIDVVRADLANGVVALREALPTGADLLWASACVHHVGDQQAALAALATLLRSGGRLALAEGGLPARRLPWDLGIGDPGLEMRLQAAEDAWFARMRAHLPQARRMPYGWTEALHRAGLAPVTTRTTLWEKPVPLQRVDRLAVVAELAHRVDRLRPTMLIQDGDLAAWRRLLDPDDVAWLGHREDLSSLVARSVHIGLRP